MRAVRWRGPGQVAIEDIGVPVPGPGEAVLAMEACGVCGTDVRLVQGEIPFAESPVTLGHECCGRVVELGPGVDPAWLGRRVAVDPQVVCGTCPYCRRGRLNLCQNLRHLGMNRDGGMAERMSAPVRNLYALPDGTSPAEGALVETLACCLAAWVQVRPTLTETVHIVGDGPTALLFLQLARLAGVRRVSLSGQRPQRLELAGRLGADEVYREEDVPAHRDAYDVVVEAAGGPTSFAQAVALCAPAGRVLLFGHHGRPVPVEMGEVLLKEVAVVPSRSSNHAWEAAVDIVRQRAVRLEALVSERIGLEDVPRVLVGFPPGTVKLVAEIA